jgi:hypoxanthine phosphoribosyltransferase
MRQDIQEILYDEPTIAARVAELGRQITTDYAGESPVIICILRGASVFMADLIRAIDLPLQIDFMSVSSYGDSTVSSGVVKIRKDVDIDIAGRHVIVVEDILDTGRSLRYILDYLNRHQPASLKTCILLDKPEAHLADIPVDYLGFAIPNAFVVGYGLDYAEVYRNLPYIGILKKEVYS